MISFQKKKVYFGGENHVVDWPKLESEILAKLKAYKEKALNHYKQTSLEYQWLDRCIEVFEELRSFNQQKRDEEEKQKAHRQQHRYQRQQQGNYQQQQQTYGFSSTFGNLDESQKEILPELLKAGYKALSLKYHPDKGGEGDKMASLNGLNDQLKQSLL